MMDFVGGSKIGSFLLGLIGGLVTLIGFSFSTRSTARKAMDQSIKNETKINKLDEDVNGLKTSVAVIAEQTKGIPEIQSDVKKILMGNVNK